MNPTGPTTRRRRTAPRRAAAAAGASALAVAAGAAWISSGASADPVQSDVAAVCSLGGSNVDVTVPMSVDDAVDPVAPGGHETLRTDQGLPSLPVEVTINSVTVTTPIPAQIASTDAVSFEGGNMAGASSVEGSNLVITFTGPMSSSQVQFPTVVVDQTVSDAPGASTIEWPVWSQMTADTNFGVATCTPNDPGRSLNSTTIDGAGGSDTTAPGGDDGATTTTTAPAEDDTTTTTAPPAATPSAPGVEVEVCVQGLPAPIPCPITLPPSADGGLPVPVPGGGVPLPAPGGDGSGLPVPLPGGGLPVPLPPSGGVPDLGGIVPSLPGAPSLPVPPAGDGSGSGVTIDAHAGVTL